MGRVEDRWYRCEWVVVMRPLMMPKLSSSTLAKGARPLVVHDALEMILSVCVWPSALTPIT